MAGARGGDAVMVLRRVMRVLMVILLRVVTCLLLRDACLLQTLLAARVGLMCAASDPLGIVQLRHRRMVAHTTSWLLLVHLLGKEVAAARVAACTPDVPITWQVRQVAEVVGVLGRSRERRCCVLLGAVVAIQHDAALLITALGTGLVRRLHAAYVL